MLRLMRRPPDSCMPRQFLKGSVMKRLVGIVVIVLSQFCTLTVCKAMSMTKPSAFRSGISRSEEHTSELQSRGHLVCRLLLEKRQFFIIYCCHSTIGFC